MVRNLLNIARISMLARRALSLAGRAGKAESAGEAMFERLEDRLVLAADLTGTMNASLVTALSSAGGSLAGTLLLQNTGNAAANGFTYRLFLSTDTVIGNEDDVQLADPVPLNLAAGASVNVNLGPFTVPTDVRPGAYFVIAVIDPINAIAENSETNNQVNSSTPVLTLNGAAAGTPNLNATVAFTARTINPDQSITIPTTVRNTGAATAEDLRVVWVLSTNATIGDADDIAIDEEIIASLAAGGSVNFNRTITLPVGVPVGAYRLGVWVDDNGSIAESNESDNRAITPTAALTVALPELSGTFTTTGGSIAPGSFFTGTLTVRNNTAAAASPFNVYICLSTDNVAGNADDILLMVVDITDPANDQNGLAGSGVRTISNLRVYMPFGNPAGGAINPGAYRVSIVIDPDNDIAEGNETNNTAITPTAVVTVPNRDTNTDPAGADLFSYVYPVTGSFLPGQTVTVPVIFANLGNAEATGGVTLRAYLSTDSTFSNDDVLMDSDIFDGAQTTFGVGQLYSLATLTIPGSAPNGAFFVILRADEGETVTETSDANNTASAAGGTVVRSAVSIIAVDAATGEVVPPGVANGGQFRISRTGSTATALVVNYTVSGTASAADYNSAFFTGQVTIPAGQSFVNLNLSIVDDILAENDETLILTLAADPFYTITAAQSAATATILDNEPRVSLTGNDVAAAESSGVANPGLITITRTGSNAAPMTVLFEVAGTADVTDFSFSSAVAGSNVTFDTNTRVGTITIPAGALSVTLTVNATQDALAEATETVLVSLQADAGYSVSPTLYRTTVNISDDEPVVTIAALDAAAGEPLSGVINGGRFRVTRTAPATGALVVNYTVSGTATSGDDFNALTGTVTIPAGSLFADIDLTVIDDAIVENGETVIVTLSADNAYRLSTVAAQRTATVNIADNETEVTISVVDPAATETLPAGPANGAQFRVNRTATNTAQALVVNYTITGTATNGTDYTTLSGTVTIPAGQSSALINVAVTDDNLAESAETVILTLDPSTSYRLSATAALRSATASIADNEPTVSITATDAAAGEAVVPPGPLNPGNIRISRTGGDINQPLVVNITVGGTASNADWVNFLDPTITIPAGAAFYDLPIVIIDDALFEGVENVVVTLGAGTSYHLTPTVAQRTATVNITDNESRVNVVALDPAGGEVNAPGVANNVTFRISRSIGSTAAPLVVNYSLGGSAANAADYTSLGGTATILAGQSFVDVVVQVINDNVAEPTETVTLTITPNAAYEVSPTQPSASATITDNEPVVTIAIVDGTAGEVTPPGLANPGQFRVTRTGPTTGALVVNYTVAGTATAGDDYDTLTGTVTIPAGQLSATFNLTVVDDNVGENNETVIVTLAADNAYNLGTAAQQTATVTIADNEPTVSVTALDPAAGETSPPTVANNGTFRITRTGATTSALVVNYTVAGTATAGDDYTTLTGTATIPAGATFVDVVLTALDDNEGENPETVILNLGTGTGYRLGTAAQQTATVTIADNEPTVSVTALDPAAGETSPPTVANNGTFRITRTGATTSALVVNYTVAGTATTGDDYTALTGTATIPAGAAFVDVVLTALDDNEGENAETVILNLGTGTGYRLGTAAQQTATVTIADNEPTVTVAVVDATSAEVASGVANNASVRFTRVGGSTAAALTVNYTMAGTATNGDDYTALTGTVIIPAGATFVDLPIIIIDDLVAENAESAIVNMAAGAGYRLGTAAQQTATISIADNEPTFGVIAIDAAGAELAVGTNPMTYRVSRTGGVGTISVVNFTISGTASATLDFTVNTGASITFDANTGMGTITFSGTTTFADLIVTPINDGQAEPAETVIVTLNPATNGQQEYRLNAAQTAATGTIAASV